MSEKNIVVPEGMLKAVYQDAITDADGVVRYSPSAGVREIEMRSARNYLASALRWLTDNPIVPTPEQVAEIVSFRFGIPATDLNANMVVSGLHAAVDWQRRMFLSPELEVKPTKTFTAEEIEHALRESYKGGDYDADWVWRKMQIYLDVAPEPEVPEEIKQLQKESCGSGLSVEALLVEAYRRGQKAGTK